MKTIKKDECSYSVSNAIRTLAMVPLSGPEARCMAIEQDTADVAAAQAEITAWAESATPAATGLLPPDMTYEQFCEEWQRSYPAAPSQANFELWMQML